MGKEKLTVGIIVLFVIISGIFYSVNYEKKDDIVFLVKEEIDKTSNVENTNNIDNANESLETISSSLETEAKQEEIVKKEIYVHICGEIINAGVYCLEEGSRIADLIELAGGFTKKADLNYTNQAQKLNDGEKIYIPSKEEVSKSEVLDKSTVSSSSADKININTADKSVLMTLSGIGESKAEAIIRYREEHGGFSSIEQLKEIEGIKDGVFNKIKDKIVV